MVGVEFNGRLGNQIFQLAFLEYLRSNNKTILFFVVNPHHTYLTRYFDLGLRNDLVLGSKIYSIFTRFLPTFLSFRKIYIESIQVPKNVQVLDNTIYRGFFQSDYYVQRIIGDFNIKIKRKFVNQFKSQFSMIFDNNRTIAIHIRRTDYLHYGKRDISLPIQYFERILSSIDQVETYKVIFVSDEIEYVKNHFGVRANYIFSSNNEIIDFQIIKEADIAIISNSSFSWWAAYLSEKEKVVYAPKNWLGFRIGKEHPKNIMTKKFVWCDVSG